jgi:hypothetical protein
LSEWAVLDGSSNAGIGMPDPEPARVSEAWIGRRFSVSGSRLTAEDERRLFEDLEQVACLALVKAVDGFDPSRGTALSSYAVPCVSDAIKRYFRDYGWAVRVPRELQELALRVKWLDDERFAEVGRHATAAELATAAVDVEAVARGASRVAIGLARSSSRW